MWPSNPVYLIERRGPGRLGTMAAPPGGDELRPRFDALRADGVVTVVSLLDDVEAEHLGLAGEAEAAQEAGLEFVHLRTDDRGTPEPDAALAVARSLREQLAEGGGVVVHCRAGIGRSSVLAAIVLRLEGVLPDQAWHRISKARGWTVPDTQSQRDFLDNLLIE